MAEEGAGVGAAEAGTEGGEGVTRVVEAVGGEGGGATEEEEAVGGGTEEGVGATAATVVTGESVFFRFKTVVCGSNAHLG